MVVQRPEFHKAPFTVFGIHPESDPDQHRCGNDPETDADPLVDTCHVHDDEDYEQREQSSCKDEQVLALESLELRAAPDPLVDIEIRHITGRMSVRWWRRQSGRYTHRTSWRQSLRCPGRLTRTWNRLSRLR